MKEIKTKIIVDKNGNRFVKNYISAYDNHSENGKRITVDLDGKVIERPKSEYPYNYSDFCIYNASKETLKKIEDDQVNYIFNGIYSDRMFSQNPDRYNSSMLEIFENTSQCFDNKSPMKIEKFLQVFYKDKSLVLTKIIESCNQSSGFPLWYFAFSKKKS